MLLLTKSDMMTLPPIRRNGEGPTGPAIVKWFTPDSSWTWYCAEASAVLADDSEAPLTDASAAGRVDVLCYGVVHGYEREYGYWALNDLAGVHGHLGLPVERDRYFRPTPLADCP